MIKYESYKESNIDWIGKIPNHWEVTKPKYKLNRVTRPPEIGDEVITCFRDGVVTLRKNRREDGFTVALKEHGYQQIRPGDLVVHEMDGFAGAIGISDSKGKSTPVYTVIEPDKNNDLRYVAYLLKEMSKSGKIESLARSIRERTTDFRWNMWSVCHFPFPPVKEQVLISRYLDKKTKQIESLIKKIKKKIELLKEQKTSLINQYVTKGLDIHVERKDSGVDWIGDIPKHWNIIKFKYITSLMTCGHAATPEYVDDGVVFLSAQNIKNGKLEITKFKKIKNDLHLLLSKKNKIKKGDLLQVRVGGASTIGETCIVDIDIDFSIYVSLSHIKLNEISDKKYIKFLCNSSKFREACSVEMKKGGGVANLNVSDLERYKIPKPPKKEQEYIANTLEKEISKIEKVQKKLEMKINLLEEYRLSLISSVITGKMQITKDML